jgi:hypothetical protein
MPGPATTISVFGVNSESDDGDEGDECCCHLHSEAGVTRPRGIVMVATRAARLPSAASAAAGSPRPAVEVAGFSIAVLLHSPCCCSVYQGGTASSTALALPPEWMEPDAWTARFRELNIL